MGDPTPARPRARRRSLLLAAAVLVLLIVIAWVASVLYTETLWFRELRASSVYRTMIWTKIGLAAVFGAAFVVAVLLTIWLARRITPDDRASQIPDQIVSRYRATVQPYARRLLVAV